MSNQEYVLNATNKGKFRKDVFFDVDVSNPKEPDIKVLQLSLDEIRLGLYKDGELLGNSQVRLKTKHFYIDFFALNWEHPVVKIDVGFKEDCLKLLGGLESTEGYTIRCHFYTRKGKHLELIKEFVTKELLPRPSEGMTVKLTWEIKI